MQAQLDTSAIVVGHTLNWRVRSQFDGKVFAIDVRHLLDYRRGFPQRCSQGLWLQHGKAWRIYADGSRTAL